MPRFYPGLTTIVISFVAFDKILSKIGVFEQKIRQGRE